MGIYQRPFCRKDKLETDRGNIHCTICFVFEKEVSVEIVNTIVNGATECTFEILGLKEEGVYIFKR